VRFLALVCLLAIGCATIGHTLAYKKATAVREKTAALLAKADEPYGRHADEVLELVNEVDEASTQARTHTDSRASKQWLIVKDELQKLTADWQHLEALGGPYLEERKKILLGDLDAIINDEAGKKSE
jgi:hypothetical protein